MDLCNKTVLVTGANSGVGFESAMALAAGGARVVLACRDPERGERATRLVRAVAAGPAPELLSLDLTDLGSVRNCAQHVRATGRPIDVLMLNAGVMAMPRSHTQDGFEMHFGTNHLGHFALAGLLMPSVLAAAAPRVVTTASIAHWWGRMRWEDPNWRRRYSKSLAYGQSKLANLLFTLELDRRVRAAGVNLLAVAAHPGSANTNLATVHDNVISRLSYRGFVALTSQSAAAGALPLLHAVTAPNLPGASYWGPCSAFELRGAAAPAKKASRACRASDAQRLWQLSEQLTGVSWHGVFKRDVETRQ